MRLHKMILSTMLLLLLISVPVAYALTVTINGQAVPCQQPDCTSADIRGTYPGGFTIETCLGCAGPARVFFDPPDITGVHRLLLSAALITASSPGNLIISVDHTAPAVPPGFWPFGFGLSGNFDLGGPTFGQQISITARAQNCVINTFADCPSVPPSFTHTVTGPGSISFFSQAIKDIFSDGSAVFMDSTYEIIFMNAGDSVNLP
jgi:hypothetical protein